MALVNGVIKLTNKIVGGKNPSEDELIFCSKRDSNSNEVYFLGVLDGCGGSGGKKYKSAEDWSGARISSHEVGRTIHGWFESNKELDFLNYSAEEIASSIKSAINNTLSELSLMLKSTSKIKSSMSRELPTTLAALMIEAASDSKARLLSFWAGDSRAYCLNTESGLIQLTKDDLNGGYDPYEDITKDGILCNVISSSNDYVINTREFYIDSPCLLICATDGCFSYLKSPIELEMVILSTLETSNSPKEWEETLLKYFDDISGDDHTLIIAIVGFKNFNAVKQAYKNRYQYMEMSYSARLNKSISENDIDSLNELWEEYKKDYYIYNMGEK